MVLSTHNYRNFSGTGAIHIGQKRVYGVGIRTFGDGIKGFGVPKWIRSLKNQALIFGKKHIPTVLNQLKMVGKHVIATQGADLTKAIAAEATRTLGDTQKGQIASALINAAGNAAVERAKASDPKLEGVSKVTADALGKSSKQLIAQALANRKQYQETMKAKQTNGGAINSSSNFTVV